MLYSTSAGGAVSRLPGLNQSKAANMPGSVHNNDISKSLFILQVLSSLGMLVHSWKYQRRTLLFPTTPGRECKHGQETEGCSSWLRNQGKAGHIARCADKLTILHLEHKFAVILG